MHRKYEGKNKDIKDIFEYLKEDGFKVKYKDCLKRLFRQFIMSWALKPGPETD
jgi:hypothetical protein